MKKVWYKGTVLQGEKVGRTIGFPTVNLSPTIIPQDTKQGVYAAIVNVDDKSYRGALYFGPRLVKGEANTVLEIYLFEFEGEIYGKTISFQLAEYIRKPQNFQTISEMKEVIKKDVAAVRKTTDDEGIFSPLSKSTIK